MHVTLYPATESTGGCHEFLQRVSRPARRHSRSPAQGRQDLRSRPCAVVFDPGHSDRRQFLPRHPHLHRDAPHTPECGVRLVVEAGAGVHGYPLHSSRTSSGGCRTGVPQARRTSGGRKSRSGSFGHGTSCAKPACHRHRRQGAQAQLRQLQRPQGRATAQRLFDGKRPDFGSCRNRRQIE